MKLNSKIPGKLLVKRAGPVRRAKNRVKITHKHLANPLAESAGDALSRATVKSFTKVSVKTKSIVRGRPPESLLRFTGFTMYKLAQNLFERTNQHLSECGVKGRSFCALHVLISEGPSTQQCLCDGMWIDRATMVAVIDELESLGYVERKSDPTDRRVHRIDVTSIGRKFHAITLKEFEKLDRLNFQCLSNDELALLRRFLDRMMQSATSLATLPVK